MATTAAERQAAYRRRRAEGTGDKRLNTWISADASRALDHLARLHSMTQRSILEYLILAANAEHISDSAPSTDAERLEHLSRTRRARIGLLAQAMVDVRNASDATKEATLKNARQLVRESTRARAEERKLLRRLERTASAQTGCEEDDNE